LRGSAARRVAGAFRAHRSQAGKKEQAMDSSHTAALQSKHHGLEQRIREEMNRPAPDHTILQTLKKQKLRIKQELSDL
jgi:hypothetical protein